MSVQAYLLHHLTHIGVSGKNPRQFLQGQFTCDLNEVNAGLTRLGAHCNPQGRMLALGRIFQFNERLYLILPSSICGPSLKALEPYAKLSRIDFIQTDLQSIGIMGEKANKRLASVFDLPHKPDECLQHDNFLIIKLPGENERFQIIGPSENIEQLSHRLQLNLQNDLSRWLCADIEAGLAFLCPDTMGKFLPHDIHLPQYNGVSFNKGCYIGQEIIARMHYLAKLKKQLSLVEIISEKEPQAGGKILDLGQKVQAELICYEKSSASKYIGLAVFSQAPEQPNYFLENALGTVHSIKGF